MANFFIKINRNHNLKPQITYSFLKYKCTLIITYYVRHARTVAQCYKCSAIVNYVMQYSSQYDSL